jgi:hypothetical protein
MQELPELRTAAVEGAELPAMRWVSEKQLEGEGLSSSVCKVAKLAMAAPAGSRTGIKRFFAAVSK